MFTPGAPCSVLWWFHIHVSVKVLQCFDGIYSVNWQGSERPRCMPSVTRMHELQANRRGYHPRECKLKLVLKTGHRTPNSVGKKNGKCGLWKPIPRKKGRGGSSCRPFAASRRSVIPAVRTTSSSTGTVILEALNSHQWSPSLQRGSTVGMVATVRGRGREPGGSPVGMAATVRGKGREPGGSTVGMVATVDASEVFRWPHTHAWWGFDPSYGMTPNSTPRVQMVKTRTLPPLEAGCIQLVAREENRALPPLEAGCISPSWVDSQPSVRQWCSAPASRWCLQCSDMTHGMVV
jgi:hypothetical protein